MFLRSYESTTNQYFYLNQSNIMKHQIVDAKEQSDTDLGSVSEGSTSESAKLAPDPETLTLR